MIVADQPGTGKTLLSQVIGIVGTGREPSAIGEAGSYEEWGKVLLSALITGPPMLLIDNIVRKLDAQALARALTAGFFEDRILGRSEMVRVPVDSIFVGTSNNPLMSSEMSRRVVRIALNTGLDQPQARKPEEFQHPYLKQWVEDNRLDQWNGCSTATSLFLAGWSSGYDD